MKTFGQFREHLTEMTLNNPTATLKRAGTVEERVDAKSIEITLKATVPMTMHDGTVIQMPAGQTSVRARRASSDRPMELTMITVAEELRGSATIALALVKRVREIASEPILLSDVRSPSGKRLVSALNRLGWTYDDDQKQTWIK